MNGRSFFCVLWMLYGAMCTSPNPATKEGAVSADAGREERIPYVQDIGEADSEEDGQESSQEDGVELQRFESNILRNATEEDVKKVIQLNRYALCEASDRHKRDLSLDLTASEQEQSLSWMHRVIVVLRKVKHYIQAEPLLIKTILPSKEEMVHVLDRAIEDLVRAIDGHAPKVSNIRTHIIPKYLQTFAILENHAGAVLRMVHGAESNLSAHYRLSIPVSTKRFSFVITAIKVGLIDLSTEAARVKTIRDLGATFKLVGLTVCRPSKPHKDHLASSLFSIPITIVATLRGKEFSVPAKTYSFISALEAQKRALQTMLEEADSLIRAATSFANLMPTMSATLAILLQDLIAHRGIICWQKAEMDAVLDACDYLAGARKELSSSVRSSIYLRNMQIVENYLAVLEDNIPALTTNLCMLHLATANSKAPEDQPSPENEEGTAEPSPAKKLRKTLAAPAFVQRRDSIFRWKEVFDKKVEAIKALSTGLMLRHPLLIMLRAHS